MITAIRGGRLSLPESMRLLVQIQLTPVASIGYELVRLWRGTNIHDRFWRQITVSDQRGDVAICAVTGTPAGLPDGGR